MALAKTHIKKDDTVMVITGKDAGKTGKVLQVLPSNGKVIVEGINVVKRHTKPTQKNPQGGIMGSRFPCILTMRTFCTIPPTTVRLRLT